MIGAAALVCLLAVSAYSQELSGVRDNNGVKLWRDRGGTSGKDLTIYEATRPGSDWYLLGQRAQRNYNKMEQSSHAFKDRSGRALRRPTGFRFIWDDRGSTYYDDASVWRPICPSGYEALGDVFARKNRQATAPSELYDKVRCVASRLTDYCSIGSKIWDNAGTIGKYYISLWSVNERSGQFRTGFFYARDQHNERPNVNSRCLRNSAVRELF